MEAGTKEGIVIDTWAGNVWIYDEGETKPHLPSFLLN